MSILISMSFVVLIHTSTSTFKMSLGLVQQENEVYEHCNQHVFHGTNSHQYINTQSLQDLYNKKYMSILISMSFVVLTHTSTSTLKMSLGLVQQQYMSILISMSFVVLIHTSTSTFKMSLGLVQQENEIYEHCNQHVFHGTNSHQYINTQSLQDVYNKNI